MKLTHLGHACLLAETGTARLLLDPEFRLNAVTAGLAFRRRSLPKAVHWSPSASAKTKRRRLRRLSIPSILEQELGRSFGDRRGVQAIGGVEVGEAAGLPEFLDAERRDALAEDSAEP